MKKSKFILSILVLILLSGCSAVRERIEQEMWKRSGVSGEVSYVQYQQLKSENALDEDGLYHSRKSEQKKEAEEPSGAIHVSFARNDNLQLEYYADAALSEPLERYNCYLNPGDTIYAAAPILLNNENGFYQFSELRVLEIDVRGASGTLLAAVRDLPGEVFHIPEDFSGTEISLVPLGEYRDRTVDLKAVYREPSGNETILENGIWSVNGTRHGNGSVNLNPMGSYRIVYDYSAYRDAWYVESSEPDSYWDRNSDSTITFVVEPSGTDCSEYKVRLHPYGTLTILNGISNQTVVESLFDGAANLFSGKSIIEMQNLVSLLQVNGITQVNNFSETEIKLSEMKVGDEIFLRIPAELKLNAEGIELPASERKEDSREYRFQIPDRRDMNFRLAVSRRNSDENAVFHERWISHGTLAVYDNAGILYREGSELPAADERVTVEITPETEFCVYGKNVKNNVYRAVMKYSEFETNLASILSDHPIRPGIIVTLDTEDELGSCVFWTGTDMIQGRVVLREDQDLQFDYLLNAEGDYEIILTPEERAQLINVWSPFAASRVIEVDASLQGKTLHCRDFVTLQERVKTDDITDTY